MLHTKYLSSRLCGFRQEDFLSFSFWLQKQPEFCMEWNSLDNFDGASCKKHQGSHYSSETGRNKRPGRQLLTKQGAVKGQQGAAPRYFRLAGALPKVEFAT